MFWRRKDRPASLAPVDLFFEQIWGREKEILVAYYFLGWSQTKIAGKLGITRERVRQIRERGLERLGIEKEIVKMLDKVHKRAYDIRRYSDKQVRFVCGEEEEPYELKHGSDVH